MSEHVILVAFEFESGSRAAAHYTVQSMLNRAVDEVPTLECWWVAEDDRLDGSDNDSAVFCEPGKQFKAAATLYARDLTGPHNVLDWRQSKKWEDRHGAV